jgi:hypothetical protein
MGFAVVVQEAAPSRGRGLGGRGRYLPTVARLTSTTSLSNSPRMRGAPELIWRIKSVPPSTALCSMKVDGSRFSGRLPGMGAITYSSCTLDSDGHAANPNSTSAHYKRINRRRRAYFSAVSRPTRLSRHAKAKCTITSRPLRSSPISAQAPSASNASTITQSSRKCSISPRTPILCNCGHRSAPSWAQRRRAGATNRPSRSRPSRNHLAAHTRRTSCPASAHRPALPS